MEMAGLISDPLSLPSTGYSIPVQTSAVNAALMEQAAAEARLAMTMSMDALRQGAGIDARAVCSPAGAAATWGPAESWGDDATSIVFSRSYSMLFVEAVSVAREATMEAISLNRAVADGQFSRETTVAEAARLAGSAPVLSRSHAAHLLVGGDPGMGGTLEMNEREVGALGTAWCTRDLPVARTRAAIQVIREAAPPASWIADLSTPSTADFLVTGADSVRSRLLRIRGLPSTTFDTDSHGFADNLGLTVADFDAARARLHDEHRAFARSQATGANAVYLASRTLPGGAVVDDLYAATGAPAALPELEHYAYTARWQSATPVYASPHDAGYVNESLSHVLDYAYDSALELEQSGVWGDPESEDGAMIPIAAFLASIDRERPARLRLLETGAGVQAMLEHHGAESTDSVVLVLGADALSCAVRGTVEGIPCSWDAATMRSDATYGPSSELGFDTRHTFTLPITDEEYHLLALRPGATGLRPGAYTPLIGFWSGNLAPSQTTLIPVVPELSRLAAELIAPSPEWCTHPQITCAGATFDGRFPLENELSSDGDAYESSWRYWLSLANQAAREADELGERVIAEGLQNDLRAEAAASTLEELCGGSVDLDGIVQPDGSDAREGVSCPGTPCGSEYVCRGGECIRDPLLVLETLASGDPSNPGATRLLNCLGDDVAHDYVALGTSSLCLWRPEGNRVDICGEVAGLENVDCPLVVADSSPTDCSSTGVSLPPGYEWVFVGPEQQLGYFESTEPGSGQQRATPPCDALAALRDPTVAPTREMVEQLWAGFFDPVQLARAASRIGWEARIHDYAGLTLDGRPWGPTTGDPFNGPAVAGVCDASATTPVCTAYGSVGEGLFSCHLADCANADVRAGYNDRTLRAVLLARLINNVGLSGIVVPVPDDYGFDGSATTVRAAAGSGLVHWTFADDGTRFCQVGIGAPRLWRYSRTVATLAASEYPFEQTGECVSTGLNFLRLMNLGEDGEEPRGDTPAYWFWAGLGVVPTSAGTAQHNHRFHSTPPLRDLLFGSTPGRTEPGRWIGDSNLNRRSSSIRLLDDGFRVGNVLDAVELLCEAARSEQSVPTPIGGTPPEIRTASDVDRTVQFLERAANELQQRGESIVFSDFPVRATDALRQQSSVGAYPATGGAYAQNITALRGSLIELASIPGLLAEQIRASATDLDEFRLQVERIDNQRELADLSLVSTVSSQVTACLLSALEGSWTKPQSFAAPAISCVNSVVQMMVASQVHTIAGEDADLNELSQVYALRERFHSRLAAMQQLTTRMQVLLEQIDSALVGAQTVRAQARSAFSQALFLDSDPADVHAVVNRATRNRYNLTRVRAERARLDAIHMAFLAKRAIEQRLGMPLSSMRDEMSLVEAPARWEARVCELQGVNYTRLRDETDLDVTSFADDYIGDYVQRLERVVQSYQLDHPFRDGQDVAVVSLRDDVQNVRGWCEQPTRNLLYEAGQLDATQNSLTAAPVWVATSCREESPGVLEPNCVVADRLLETDGSHDVSPFVISSPELQDSQAQRVYFGNPDGAACLTDGTCGLTTTTALSQSVELGGGRYRLSWYGALSESGSTLDPATVVDVVDSAGATLVSGLPESSTDGCGTGWTRFWHIFDVGPTDSVRVQVIAGGSTVSRSVDLAGLMLEDVSDSVVASPTGPYVAADHPPGIFENTRATLSRFQQTCEDTTGQEFRSRGWRRNCMRLCAEGFGRGCESDAADLYCYWETSFTITQRDIERGRTFTGAGFARGNYNYRLDTLALNVVGTGVRDCEGSSSPSSCYSGGFVPYTLQHVGPYTVRNVLGDDYDSPLFTASIEHGRALGAERHLSNPISSADRALIDPYTHDEFRGRPIDGTYILRVWDEPGIDFQQIEDVQVVMGYRYWTRSE